MSRPLVPMLLASLAATLSCGAAAPRTASPTTKSSGPPPVLADEPLVRGPMESDADIARALREHYTKYEYRIPMRDGTKLFTNAFVPKDTAHSYPILFFRTPYGIGPYGADAYLGEKDGAALRRFAPSAQTIRDGYIFVHQDVRGKMMSEGTFVDVRPHASKPGEIDESTDAYDTIDWLVKNVPGNSGKVGGWGISYPGFYAAQMAVNAHPALKAVSPQAPVTEWFIGDDFHQNGAFMLAEAYDFYENFGKARPEPVKKVDWNSSHEGQDSYDFFLAMGPIANANTKHFKDRIAFWNDLFAHPNRDEFWKARDPRPYYRDAKPAVMTVGGWFDKEDLWGALETYRAFERQNPRSENVLVMGPWRHGGWSRDDGDRLGNVTFGQKTSPFYREQIERAFFQRHLKGKSGPPSPEAWIFETGTNEWHTYSSWPPAETKATTLFFQPNGKLASAAPSKSDKSDEGYDAYISDPGKPVPHTAKPGEQITFEFLTEDQRFAARRPDVLVYSTDALDADVTLAGPVEASLWVSTTGTDADFVVKVIDVWPPDGPDPDPNNARLGGYQQLVRANVMRGKFRSSFEHPEPFKPNEPTLVKLTLPDVSHTLRAGHRLMVQVQSSWFPLVDRNPQTFVDIYRATEQDFRVATHRVFRAKDHASSVKLGLLRGSLPTAR